MAQEAKKEESVVPINKFWRQWVPLVRGERRYDYTQSWDPFMVRFSAKWVPIEEAEKAMEALYINCTMEMGDDGLTPLEDMKSQFHFITKEKDILKLREMKRKGIKCCRGHMKFFIGVEMELETEKRVANGEILNMNQYLEMFELIRIDHAIPDYIKTSKKWVENWQQEIEEESKSKNNAEKEEPGKSDEQPKEGAESSGQAAGSSGQTETSEEAVDVKDKPI